MESGGPRASLEVEVQPHHEQRKICASRAKYREGRKPRAVRVYTINLESRYLLVLGVPAIGVMEELVQQFALYGVIEEYNVLHEYPAAEEFTEVYLIKFQKLQSARVAKRKLDERSFFGGLLHICYAPEFESVQETREKLQDRRRYVAWATSRKAEPAAEKRQEGADHSSVTLVQSELSYAHPSSCDSAIQHRDPLAPFYACPPPASCDSAIQYNDPPAPPCDSAIQYRDPLAPFYGCPPSASTIQYTDPLAPFHAFTPPASLDSRQEYFHPVQPSPCESRIQANDHAYPVERTINPARRRPYSADTTATRFMPRTTQLQERQRRREESTALALSLPEPQEIVIGPQLPEIPKLDMEDDSLNTSADFIRGKLKEVSAPPSAQPAAEDPPAATPVKQRRRI